MARRPPQRPGRRAAQGRGGRGGRGTQSHHRGALGRPRDRARPGPRGTLLPPHSGPLQPGTAGSRDGSRGTGRPTHPPGSSERRTPGPKSPAFPEAGGGGRGGARAERPERPGAERDDRVPSPRWVLPYSQWVSLRWTVWFLEKEKESSAPMAIFSKCDFPEYQTWCLFG